MLPGFLIIGITGDAANFAILNEISVRLDKTLKHILLFLNLVYRSIPFSRAELIDGISIRWSNVFSPEKNFILFRDLNL